MKRARDTRFKALRYRRLQSRGFVHYELDKLAKADEVVLLKAKLLPKGRNVDTILSHWRLIEVSELVTISLEAPLNVHALDVSSDNLELFSQEAGF